MTTFFRVYARSVMFRQAFSSVLKHLKEHDYYVKEFLVINDWYDGRSLALNGTFSGPKVHETRKEMLSFFPGCKGASVQDARYRDTNQKCTFIFKDESERGQAKSLNILLDLMVTQFWIHFEDDHMFYQDFFVSRLLEPIYAEKERCEMESAVVTTTRLPTTRTLTSTSMAEPTVWPTLPTVAPAQLTEPTVWPALPTVPPAIAQAPLTAPPPWQPVPSAAEVYQPTVPTEAQPYTADAEGGEFQSQTSLQGRQLASKHCKVVAGVRLKGKVNDNGVSGDAGYEVDKYHAPDILFNNSYVQELLEHGGLESDEGHSWGVFRNVGAVRWPLFTLRPSLLNLTYIKSLQAPLFFEGKKGRFSEDPNMTHWQNNAGQDYKYHWDFELEFAVRWVRAGATFATLSPGTCMRDISNGISSLEKNYTWEPVDLEDAESRR